MTLAVQLQQNLDDQLTQLEEQTFAAIDLAESTDEQDSLTDDLLQVTLEADSLKFWGYLPMAQTHSLLTIRMREEP